MRRHIVFALALLALTACDRPAAGISAFLASSTATYGTRLARRKCSKACS